MGLVTSLRMVGSMVAGAMAGVPEKPAGMTIGCRLILDKRWKCVLLLLRETEMVMNGLQPSSCPTHQMLKPGHLTKM